MVDFYLFPTEALLLGECLGEYLQAGGRFLDHVRRRLVPIFPSLIERKDQYGLGELLDKSKKTLLEEILLELSGSFSSNTLDEQYALHPSYELLKKTFELASEIAKLEGRDADALEIKQMLESRGKDEPGKVEVLICKIAEGNGHTDLLNTGRAFGELIALCEAAARFLGNPEGYVLEEDAVFSLDEYVTPADLTELADLDLVHSSGVTHDLLRHAAKQVSIPLPLEQHFESPALGIDRVNQLLGALWFAFGEALSHVREKVSATQLIDLISQGETTRVEFKATLRFNLHTNKNDDRMQQASLKTIAAFLNSQGGHLLIGVNDDKEALGLEKDQFPSEDKMNLHLVDLLKSRLGPQHMLHIEPRFDSHKGKRVLVVECRPSGIPVYLKEDNTERFYTRTGPATTALSVSEMQDYIKQRF